MPLLWQELWLRIFQIHKEMYFKCACGLVKIQSTGLLILWNTYVENTVLVIKKPKRQPAKNPKLYKNVIISGVIFFFLQTLPFQFVIAGTAGLLYREMDSHCLARRIEPLWRFVKFLLFPRQRTRCSPCDSELRAATSPGDSEPSQAVPEQLFPPVLLLLLTSLDTQEDLKSYTF